MVDAVEPRIRELLQAYPDDAGDGDRGADRLDRIRSGCCSGGWRSCGRCICRRTRRRARAMRPGRSPSAICGSRRSMLPVGFGQTRRPTQLPVLTMVTRLLAVAVGGADPDSRTAEDLFAGWWQLIEALGAVPRVLVWDGEGAVGRWRGGRVELTAECQAFRGTLAREGDHLQAGRSGSQGHGRAGRTTIWSARSCPAARSPRRRTSTPSSGVAGPGQHPAAAGVGVRADRPDRRGPGGDARRCRRSPPVTGWRARRAAAARPLHPAGLQRLLGAPGGDRPPGRGRRRPGTGCGCSATGGWSPTTADLGQAPDHLRPRPCRRRQAAAPRTGSSMLRPARPRPRWSSGAWPTTTPPSASTDG